MTSWRPIASLSIKLILNDLLILLIHLIKTNRGRSTHFANWNESLVCSSKRLMQIFCLRLICLISSCHSVQDVLRCTHHPHLILNLGILLLLKFLDRNSVAYQLSVHFRERGLLMHNAHVSQYRDVIVCREGDRAGFREEPKPIVKGHFPVGLGMVVRAMGFLAIIPMQALLHLKELRVELLLFPPVAELALIVILAPVLIGGNEIFCVPILTDILGIAEYRGLPSIVLPVVSINTDVSLVIILSVRAPDRLKMEDVEVHIWFEFFN